MNILLAEDDENDILLFERALKKVSDCLRLQVVNDGDETVRYLRGEGVYANRNDYPLPSLLLLDLRMPKKHGFEILQWIPAAARFRGAAGGCVDCLDSRIGHGEGVRTLCKFLRDEKADSGADQYG